MQQHVLYGIYTEIHYVKILFRATIYIIVIVKQLNVNTIKPSPEIFYSYPFFGFSMFLSNLSSIQVHKQSIIDIHTCAHNRSKVKNKTESKQLKQKELKRQKQNKENCFANLKG
jgi:hypothetical protein